MNTRKNKPPVIFEWLAILFLNREVRFERLGDFEELYQRKVEERGKLRALFWYASQVFRLIKSEMDLSRYWRFTMFKNYLKVALRNITNHKSYSFINISGLAVGFSCCLIILLFVQDELSYDRFHENGDRVYRLESRFRNSGIHGNSSMKMGELLKANFSEIQSMVRIAPYSGTVTYKDKRMMENLMAFADEAFFEMFSFDLISGDKTNVVGEPFTVVITEAIAQKYFGSENPVGKLLDINDSRFTATVSGVMKNMPENSHFHFDFIISMQTAVQRVFNSRHMTEVGEHWPYIYMMLPQNYPVQNMLDQFPDFEAIAYGEDGAPSVELALTKLTDIHLTSHTRSEIEANGDILYVYIFSTVALLTLLIACINYMNLATARSTGRAREVGMRKVLGAYKYQLIKQFLGESILITFVALVLAIGISYLVLPAFNAFSGKNLVIDLFNNMTSVGLFVLSTLSVGILAGSYPAFFLSAFQPLKVIKGMITRGNSGTALRKVLVVAQFGISIILIVSTAVVFKQLDFMRNKKLGINKDQVVVVSLQTLNRRGQYESLKNEILSVPGVLGVSASNKRLTRGLTSNWAFEAEDFTPDPQRGASVKTVTIDIDFFKLFGNEFAAGRDFSAEIATDATSGVILNESSVDLIGWDEPIGKWYQVRTVMAEGNRGNVIGVVKDFHFESIHNPIKPAVFTVTDNWLNFMYVKITGDRIPETISFIENTYSKFVTDREFSFTFLDDDIDQLYSSEERFLKIFGIFTSLAIAIACLGIFGLASFTAEKRTKEIGIRKVLGASINTIISLLVKEFAFLVVIANLIAWPLAYYLMNNWLESFVYKTSLGIEIFLVSMVGALTIALSTVLFQALKSATANPVNTLRSE